MIHTAVISLNDPGQLVVWPITRVFLQGDARQQEWCMIAASLIASGARIDPSFVEFLVRDWLADGAARAN